MYSEEFIANVVEFCEKRDLYLIMDDIYHRLIFDGRKPINCYKYAKKLDALEALPHLTHEEELEEIQLKKLKLRLKDQMGAIMSQYRSQKVA